MLPEVDTKPCVARCLQDLNVSHNKLGRLRGIPELLPGLQVLDITENVLEGPGELVSAVVI